ncbi:MAG TPA: hypothetical protein VGG39_26860 [Polyangiaceae bacterium]|jgi:hypothetical protein
MAIEIPPVMIEFAVSGIRDVDRAISTLDKRLARFEQDSERATLRSGAARARSAQDTAKKRLTAEEKLAKETTKLEERQAKTMEQIRRRSSEMAGRYAAQEASKEIAEREKVAKAAERIEQYKLRVRQRSSEMAGRIAEKEAAAEARARQKIARATNSGMGRGISRGARYAGMAAGAMAIGGGFALADAVSQQLAAERSAALLVNLVTTGGTAPAGANVASILARASEVSVASGMSKESLIGGTLEYSRKAKGGDFKGAMANMGFFAKLSRVTGTDINEIAGAAGTLQSQNQDLGSIDMQQMLLDVYAQGKAGSLSMGDVAKQMGTLASTRSSYAGKAADNQRKLLALGQLAAPEGSVEEAGTYIKDLTSEAGAHRKSTRGVRGLESMGVKFDKYGRMESPEQMVTSVFKGTGGDITEIEKIFGKRGTALFRALQPSYTAAGGGDAGLAAVQKQMATVTGATMTTGSLDKQNAEVMGTNAEKIDAAFNKLRDTLGDKLEPALEKIANKAPELAETLGKVADAGADLLGWLVDNKWEGLAALVGGAIVKEIATAQIGATIGKAIETGAATKLSGGLAVGSAAITAAVVTELVVDMVAKADVAQQRADVDATDAASNMAGNVIGETRRGGKVTSRDIDALKAERDKIEQQGTRQSGGFGTAVAATFSGLMGGGLTGSTQEVLDQAKVRAAGEAKNVEQALARLNKAIDITSGKVGNLGSVADNAARNRNMYDR